ncbi:MAG: hypothetical protein RR847_04020 [Bacilli bacterium]
MNIFSTPHLIQFLAVVQQPSANSSNMNIVIIVAIVVIVVLVLGAIITNRK